MIFWIQLNEISHTQGGDVKIRTILFIESLDHTLKSQTTKKKTPIFKTTINSLEISTC
jgi:hypothetical protein